VWYAGAVSNITTPDDRSPKINQLVAFTQVINNEEDLVKCYQRNDPTDTELSDLLPTDGGTLELTGVGSITKMIPLDTGLVVIAANSINVISGPDGVFRADDFSVDLLADIGTTTNRGVVNLDYGAMFANEQGIYSVLPDQAGQLAVQNLTNNSIKSWYRDRIKDNMNRLVGCIYDSAEREVRWLFNENLGFETFYELVYNLDLNAFYTHKYDTGNVSGTQLSGYIPLTGQTRGYYLAGTVNNTEIWPVYHGYDDGVTTAIDNFGELRDYDAVLTTGSITFGDSTLEKWSSYVHSHFKRTEGDFYDTGDGNLLPSFQSECTLQSRWNFSNSAASGKFGTEQQAYRYPRMYVPSGAGDPYDVGEEVITTKLRVRGTGKAMQLRYYSPPQKDAVLYGWNLLVESGNTA